MSLSKKTPLKNEAGISLVSVVMAIGLLGLISLGMLRMVDTGMRGSGHTAARVELASLQSMMMQSLSCTQTLGLNAIPDSPLDCSAYPTVTLKRRDGSNITDSNGKVGKWEISASCDGQEIIVKATRPGNDPLTNKAWNSLGSANDLMAGTSDFCRQYFDGSLQDRWVETQSARSSYTGCAASYNLNNGQPNAWTVRFVSGVTNGTCTPNSPANPTMTYGLYTRSMEVICKQAGYVGATGTCLISKNGFEAQGSILANNTNRVGSTNYWGYACLWGMIFYDLPQKILCY